MATTTLGTTSGDVTRSTSARYWALGILLFIILVAYMAMRSPMDNQMAPPPTPTMESPTTDTTTAPPPATNP